jgi:putative MATE family efflux protein
MIFCVGSLVSTMFQRFLQAVGDTFYSMVSLIAGAVTNLILDPILIFGFLNIPAMGVRGAAVATVVGQWVSAIVAIWLNAVKNPVVKIRLNGYRMDGKIVADIYKVGFPTIITQSIGSIMVALVNAILMPFSASAVAFFGVYYKLQNFLFMPMNGLGQAAIPIVGFSYGAKNNERIKSAIRTVLPIAAGIALIATIVFASVPKLLLGLFSSGEHDWNRSAPAYYFCAAFVCFCKAVWSGALLVCNLDIGGGCCHLQYHSNGADFKKEKNFLIFCKKYVRMPKKKISANDTCSVPLGHVNLITVQH